MVPVKVLAAPCLVVRSDARTTGMSGSSFCAMCRGLCRPRRRPRQRRPSGRRPGARVHLDEAALAVHDERAVLVATTSPIFLPFTSENVRAMRFVALNTNSFLPSERGPCARRGIAAADQVKVISTWLAQLMRVSASRMMPS